MANFGTFNPTCITNIIPGYSTTATAGGTTTLVAGSNRLQYFTGTLPQVAVLPDVTTLALGQSFTIVNNSSGTVTVQSSGLNVIATVVAATSAVVTCILLTGTGVASWNANLGTVVTSITGTASQITASAATGAVTLGLPASVSTGSWNLSGLTASQAVVTDGSKLLTSLADTSLATVSSIALRDASGNTGMNNLLEGYTTTATAAGTTTLVVGSTQQQYFTGTTTQTVVLPVTSTLVLGQSFIIVNNSTGLITIQSSGSAVVSFLTPGTTGTLVCILTSGTTAISWSGGNVGTYTIGTTGYGCCFDGTNIWVANFSDNTVSKLLASTGAVIGTYATGSGPTGVCFDGLNIWISNFTDGTVTKLLASTGGVVGTYTVGTNPIAICFDGLNVWTANYNSADTTKLLASTGAVVGTYTTASGPFDVCFDGTNIWVPGVNTTTVTKLLASTGALVGTYSCGASPSGACFDGTNIWITNGNGGTNTVTKLLASTGALIATYSTGSNTTPFHLCFDGTNLWISSNGTSIVTKLIVATGVISNYATQSITHGVCFDGTNIWIPSSSTVTKIMGSGVVGSVGVSAPVGVPFLSTWDNVSRDINANTRINNVQIGYATTVTAAGTLALSAMSSQQQYLTGSTTHTVTLPDVTTMALGQSFKFVNRSIGAVVINSSGGNLLVSLGTLAWGWATCILTSGTTAASWSYEPEGVLVV
jgi:hypothetical protein